MKCPVTYKQIIQYVKEHYGYAVQTCAIAAVLKELGYSIRKAWNSGMAKKRKEPNERDRKAIKEAINALNK